MDASHTTVAASTKTSVEKRKTYAEAYAEFDASVERQVAPSSLSSPIVKRPSPLPSPTISRLNQIPFAAISDTKPQMPAFPKHSIFYEPQEKEAEDLPEIESNVAPISKNSIFYEDHSCYPQPADDVAAASDSIRKSGPVPHVHTNFKIHPSIVSAGRDSALGSASAASAGTVPSMALDSFPSDSFPSSARAGRETTETLPSGASTGSRNAIFDVDFSPKQHAQAIRDDPTSSPMFPSSTQSSEEDVSVNGISINCLLRRMSPHILQDGSQLLNISKLKKVVLDFFKFNEAQVDSCNSDASKALASSQLIPLSFFPTRKNWIGEGRFAAVYRASFAIPVTSTAPSSPSMKYGPNEADKENCPNRNTFTREATEYCAVKVPHDYDREAQLNATTEAAILYFISQQTSPSRSHHIVRLVGIKMKTEDKIILRRSNDIALPLQDLRLSSPSSDTEFVPSNESSINDSLILREELFHGRIYAPTTILEYCSGGCVFDRIRSSPSLFGKRMWLKICQKLAEAVLFLHTGLDDDLTVLHLDIKPQNILLDGDMEPKLSDFGSALIVRRRQPMTLQDGLGRGTQVSTASDVYSMGCTFYSLLTGREPFKDIYNPAHQLWAIRKGFFESGANPLIAEESIMPVSVRKASGFSFSITAESEQTQHESSTSVGILSTRLLKFVNGDALHSDQSVDVQAADRIACILMGCTAKQVDERWSIEKVVHELTRIDELLIPGTGLNF